MTQEQWDELRDFADFIEIDYAYEKMLALLEELKKEVEDAEEI